MTDLFQILCICGHAKTDHAGGEPTIDCPEGTDEPGMCWGASPPCGCQVFKAKCAHGFKDCSNEEIITKQGMKMTIHREGREECTKCGLTRWKEGWTASLEKPGHLCHDPNCNEIHK